MQERCLQLAFNKRTIARRIYDIEINGRGMNVRGTNSRRTNGRMINGRTNGRRKSDRGTTFLHEPFSTQ